MANAWISLFGDTWSQKHSVHSLWSSARVLKLYFQTLSSKALLFFGTHAAQIWGTLTHFDSTAKCYYSCTLIKQDCSAHGKISFVGCYLNGHTNYIFEFFCTLPKGRTHGTKLGWTMSKWPHFNPRESALACAVGKDCHSLLCLSVQAVKALTFQKRIVCSEFELFFHVFWLSFLSSVSSPEPA